MQRSALIVGIVALVVGLSAGYLWWGMPTDRTQTELQEARGRVEALEQELAGRRADTARPDEMEALRARVRTLEEELAQERLMRSRLETIVSEGRK